MLWTAFAVGGTFFWCLTAAVLIVITACVDRDNGKGATFVAALFAAICYLFADFNPFAWLAQNLATVAALGLVYVGTGAAWALGKWWFFVKAARRRFDAFVADWLRKRDLAAIPPAMTPPSTEPGPRAEGHVPYSGSLDELRSDARRSLGKTPPQAGENKGRIMLWMTYWPVSAVWTLVDDPVRRLFLAIWEWLSGTFQRISDRAFGGTEDILGKRG